MSWESISSPLPPLQRVPPGTSPPSLSPPRMALDGPGAVPIKSNLRPVIGMANNVSLLSNATAAAGSPKVSTPRRIAKLLFGQSPSSPMQQQRHQQQYEMREDDGFRLGDNNSSSQEETSQHGSPLSRTASLVFGSLQRRASLLAESTGKALTRPYASIMSSNSNKDDDEEEEDLPPQRTLFGVDDDYHEQKTHFENKRMRRL